MQIAVHELFHTIGMAHVAGSPGDVNIATLQPSGEEIQYITLEATTCEINVMGLWYCSEKYVNSDPQQCTPEELCCGTRTITDPENKWVTADGECAAPNWPAPSAYTPTFAEPFGQMVDTWLYLNSITPTTTDAPDGSCTLHFNEFDCYETDGCFFDAVRAARASERCESARQS
jgi:hypothetical protein